MQIVIDIDEYDYKRVKELVSEGVFDYEGTTAHLFKSVANGTPLPKGHGRLIDGTRVEQHLKQKLLKYGIFPQYRQGIELALNDVIKIAPTIIKADKGE